MRGYNISIKVIKTLFDEVETILTNAEYDNSSAGETLYNYRCKISLSVGGTLNISFKQAFGDWENRDYGWLIIDGGIGYRDRSKKMKVKFDYVQEGVMGHKAINHQSIDSKKFLAKVVEVAEIMKAQNDRNVAQKERSLKFEAEVESNIKPIFPTAEKDSYRNQVSIEEDNIDLELSYTDGGNYVGELTLRLSGSLEYMRSLVDAIKQAKLDKASLR